MPFIRILTALSAALLCAQEASAADAVRVKSATLLDITGPTTDVFADAASSESLTIPVAICSCITFRGQTRDGALLFDGITDRGPNTTAPKVRARERPLLCRSGISSADRAASRQRR